ncbi:hypothetical protein NDU88_008517 [Pleurodeles waltl]|uniref:Uncharacterized protein n=1 Tax=Pleurodeles waltl TaxID=8319 RepID=A0AAV7NWS8_PLEWA|nr:hypothetical protein NDU88_008517 [Pleurodeles waltl]
MYCLRTVAASGVFPWVSLSGIGALLMLGALAAAPIVGFCAQKEERVGDKRDGQVNGAAPLSDAGARGPAPGEPVEPIRSGL